MKIREAIRDDNHALVSIIGQNYQPLYAQLFSIDFEQSFSSSPWRPKFLVADDGGVIGCACYSVDWVGYGVYSLTWVNVAADRQRVGTGRALVQRAIEEIRPRASMILLGTRTPDYYSKHWGFRCIDQYADPNDGEKIDLMSLPISH